MYKFTRSRLPISVWRIPSACPSAVDYRRGVAPEETAETRPHLWPSTRSAGTKKRTSHPDWNHHHIRYLARRALGCFGSSSTHHHHHHHHLIFPYTIGPYVSPSTIQHSLSGYRTWPAAPGRWSSWSADWFSPRAWPASGPSWAPWCPAYAPGMHCPGCGNRSPARKASSPGGKGENWIKLC